MQMTTRELQELTLDILWEKSSQILKLALNSPIIGSKLRNLISERRKSLVMQR